MFLKLPIADVDKLSDIALGKEGNLTYKRVESNTPPRITYSVTFTELDFPSWNFHIHEMTRGTEITFPVYVPEFDVIPSGNFKPGGILWILENDEEPVYDDSFEKAEYKICKSIWGELKMNERHQKISRQDQDTANQLDTTETKDTKKVESVEKIAPMFQEAWEAKVDDESDRTIIRNLRQGNPAKFAAKSLEVVEKTIYNRESILRRKLDSEVVPFRQKWRKDKSN